MCGKGHRALLQQFGSKQGHRPKPLSSGWAAIKLVFSTKATTQNPSKAAPHTAEKHFPKVDVGGWEGDCFLCQQPSLSSQDIWLPHHTKARAAWGWLIWGTPVSCWLQLLPPWDSGFPVCDQELELGPCVKLPPTWWLLNIPEVTDFKLLWQWGQSPFSPSPCGCHCLWKPATPHCWCPDLPTASAHSHKSVDAFTGKFKWHFSIVENTS